jgi:hypothetical protein
MPTFEGRHLVVFAEDELELCGGSMAHMDAFIERLADELGLPAPVGDQRIRYHWLTRAGVEAACGAPVAGCTPRGEVFTQYAPHNHELVHALTAALGLPRSLFAEGLAVAYEGLGRGPNGNYSLGAADDVLALVELSQQEFDLGYYRLAGAFTHFLIEDVGVTDYLRAYAEIARDADQARVDQVFRDTFGVSLEQGVAEFEGLPGYLGSFCAQESFDAKLLECDAPELEWDGEFLSGSRPVACEQGDVVGPLDHRLLVLYTLVVPESGWYELRMHGDTQPADPYPQLGLGERAVTGVSLQRCGGCGDGEQMATWDGGTPRLKRLRAGRYSLRLHGDAAAPSTVGFTLRRRLDPPDVLDDVP